MLRWTLQRGNEMLSCDVVAQGREYAVRVAQHRADSSPLVERFGRAADAMRRHAELAWLLRETGWMLYDRGPARSAA